MRKRGVIDKGIKSIVKGVTEHFNHLAAMILSIAPPSKEKVL